MGLRLDPLDCSTAWSNQFQSNLGTALALGASDYGVNAVSGAAGAMLMVAILRPCFLLDCVSVGCLYMTSRRPPYYDLYDLR